MPLFPKRSGKEEVTKGVLNEQNVQSKYGHQENPTSNDYSEEDTQPPTFYCQQAQGSPTGIISGFNNVKELYQKISECYDFDPNEVSRSFLYILHWYYLKNVTCYLPKYLYKNV